MPVWKRKTDNEVIFYHVCTTCEGNVANALIESGWTRIRDGEPVECIECSRNCALNSKGLWDAEDRIRYRVCNTCFHYDPCPLKGRYYC